jgi:hypothetical protein
MEAQDKHLELQVVIRMEDLAVVHQIVEIVVLEQAVVGTQAEPLLIIKKLKAEAVVHIMKVFIMMKFQKQFLAVAKVYQQIQAQMETALLN